MDSKPELLVFSKKEISVIVVLLGLVALFSFTLGLRLGRALGTAPKAVEQKEAAPLSEKGASPQQSSEGGESQPAGESSEAKPGEDHGAETKSVAGEPPAPPENAAEDRADAELAKAVSTEKVGLKKPIPMSLPNEKVADLGEGARFTLQFGSYRTVAEAADQVSALKHEELQKTKLDIFYFETKVPGKGTWYRVGVGSFPSKEFAEKAAIKLKSENKSLPPFFVQRIVP